MREAPTENGNPDEGSAGRVARDAGSTALAHFVGTGLRYLAAMLAARILGAAAFGSYTLSRTVLALLGQVSVLGLSPGVLPSLARARRVGDAPGSRALVRSALSIVSLASAALAGLVWTLAPWMAAEVFEDPALTGILRPLSVLVVVTGLSTVSLTVVQAFGGVREQAWIEGVFAGAVTALGLLLAWRWELGITGVIAAALAGPSLALLSGLRLAGRLVPGVLERGAPCAPLLLAPLLGVSWPLMAASLLTMALLRMDVVLMGVFREPAEVGVYGACARLVPAILLVQQGIAPVVSVRISQLHAARDRGGIRRLYRTTARWTSWWGLVTGWIFVLWGRELLALFGDEFTAGAGVLLVLTAGRFVGVVSGMTSRVLMMTGKGRLILWNAAFLVAGNLALDLLWIPRFGTIGAAWATSLCVVSGAAIQVVEVWHFQRILPWSRHTVRALAATTLGAGLCLAWRSGPDWSYGWLVPLSGFVLLCALAFVGGGLEDEDREALAALGRRLRGQARDPR